MDIRLCRVQWLVACVIGTSLVLVTGADEPSGPPTRSLALVAIGAIGWTMLVYPPRDDGPARRVSHAWSAAALSAAVLALAPLVVLIEAHRADLGGVVVAAAMLATYQRTWGHRCPARLRWTVVMCALIVPTVSATIYDSFETVIRLVSEIVYRRLASIELFGAADEPWKLFSAIPHTGSFFVVTLIVLGSAMCVARSMSAAGTVLYLTTTGLVGLIVHHAILMALPIEDYSPNRTVELATSPLAEAVAAVLAVVLFGLVSAPRSDRAEATRDATDDGRYADPTIYALPERSRLIPIAGLGIGLTGAIVLAVGVQLL